MHLQYIDAKHGRWLQRTLQECGEDEHLLDIKTWAEASEWVAQEDEARSIVVLLDDGEHPAHEPSAVAFCEEKKLHFIIRSFVVPKRSRREGYGKRALGYLANLASKNGRTLVDVDVSERNLDAQLFLRAAGFKARDPRTIKHKWQVKIGDDLVDTVSFYRRLPALKEAKV